MITLIDLFVRNIYPPYLKMTYTITHGEDFDPDCMVCTEYTKMIHQILGKWIKKAVIVERADYDRNPKPEPNLLILPEGDEPVLERLLKWVTTNFDEYFKLAAIDSVMFREYGTENVFTCTIRYDD